MISLRRVAVHNLKEIDLDLPIRKLIVFCGRSGSGKSSLALDTLYAEGQRHYIETFSPAMRQFLERIDKPKAERLDGIPPAVAVTSYSRISESLTVSEATEIFDYLALLFAQTGQIFCPKCSRQIVAHSPQTVLQTLKTIAKQGERLQIAFAPPLEETAEQFAEFWKEQGFLRGWFDHQNFRLDEPIPRSCYQDGLLLIVDRILFGSQEDERLIESLESAFQHGEGKCCVRWETEKLLFSQTLSCEYCQVQVPPLDAKLFRTDWINHVHIHADVNSLTMSDLNQKTVTELLRFFEILLENQHFTVTPLQQVVARLQFLQRVGLGYLTLSRRMDTLSGGEQRRIALTTVLGSSLVDMLYILDEPSLGLHAKDTAKLLETILELRDRGNTVILVEHDPLLLQSADHIVELGPGAGDEGGTIVFQGNVEELQKNASSLTSKYLQSFLKSKKHTPPRPTGSISLTGCRGHHLKNIAVTFPLGMLSVISGVSGSGKSSLIRQTLYPALCQHFDKKNNVSALPFDQVEVRGNISDVVLIDQSPMGRTTSSNPATYLKIFDDIRNVFAATVDAKAKHLTARHFSFNVAGGRCEHCKGEGNIVIDMQFLPDQIVVCPECKGKRYQQSVLDVFYRGKNIAEVLEMTVREAFSFFRGQSKLQYKLRSLFDVGLDYLRLGQPSRTLSGGESQRLRLSGYLGQIHGNRSAILMDEPTAGLHFAEVEQMLVCFQSLIQSGHSLIVIEHNEMVIEAADYRIELGPGAGNEGGTIIFESDATLG